MTSLIKVKHTETHWQCGDGCCDNYTTVSAFMYGDNIYEFDEGDAGGNTQAFLKQIIGIEFEEEFEYQDH